MWPDACDREGKTADRRAHLRQEVELWRFLLECLQVAEPEAEAGLGLDLVTAGRGGS